MTTSHNIIASWLVRRYTTYRMKAKADFWGDSHLISFSPSIPVHRKSLLFIHTCKDALNSQGQLIKLLNGKTKELLYIVISKEYTLSTTEKTRKKPLNISNCPPDFSWVCTGFFVLFLIYIKSTYYHLQKALLIWYI